MVYGQIAPSCDPLSINEKELDEPLLPYIDFVAGTYFSFPQNLPLFFVSYSPFTIFLFCSFHYISYSILLIFLSCTVTPI